MEGIMSCSIPLKAYAHGDTWESLKQAFKEERHFKRVKEWHCSMLTLFLSLWRKGVLFQCLYILPKVLLAPHFSPIRCQLMFQRGCLDNGGFIKTIRVNKGSGGGDLIGLT